MATVEARYKHNLLRDGFSSSHSPLKGKQLYYLFYKGKKNKKKKQSNPKIKRLKKNLAVDWHSREPPVKLSP